MNGSWKRAAVASALCLGLAAAATVGAAQDRQRGPGGPSATDSQRMADHQKRFEEMRARHEKAVHDILMIRPDQEAAFNAFTAALAPPPMGDKDGKSWRDHGPGAMSMTTPERLDRMAARMSERQARFQKMAAATKTFYAALSPEQRRAFDALPMMMGGHGGMHGGHRGPGGPPMGGEPPPGRSALIGSPTAMDHPGPDAFTP